MTGKHGDLDRFIVTGDDITVHRKADGKTSATLRPGTEMIGEGTVPWHVTKSSECGASKPWAVIKDATGEVAGCHTTQAEANDQLAALYASEEASVTTTTQALGGKPSKGTKKDKRLKQNQYAPDGHFGPSNSVSDAPWNGAASNFTDEQYQRAAAACDTGSGTPKERCFLPHHTPDGALSRAGLGAAAGRSNQLTGHDAAAVSRAKAHLRSHYTAIGEPVPDNLAATDEEIEEFGVEENYDDLVFVPATTDLAGKQGPGKQGPGKTIQCPPGMTPDPEGNGCVEMMAVEPAVFTEGAKTAAWHGPLTVEGIETGDGREFDKEALTWPEEIQPGEMPLRWNKEDSHGGDPHTVAVNVGRIDKVWREDSGLIMGEGLFNLSIEDGRTAYGMVRDGFLRGVSVDVDSIKDGDMEMVWPEAADDGDGGDLFGMLFGSPEKVIFHKGRIRAATLVDIPAFAEAYIALTDEEGAVVAGGQPIGALRAHRTPRPSATVEIPSLPPAEWFQDPGFSVLTGITVTQDGRVYGHAAEWNTCHIGQAGVCTTPPRESDHPYFMTGSVLTADGSLAKVGQITLGTGHAPLDYTHRAAAEHYDNTGAAVADVAVGNDAHGIWVAGALRPGATAAQIHALRASGRVSGDWRKIGGTLRLVGLLAVNVPGFMLTPKLGTRLFNGQQYALVAAGMPQLTETVSEAELDQWAYRRMMEIMSRQVFGKE